MHSDLHDSLFETSWGWCAVCASPRGIVLFALPSPERERALKNWKHRLASLDSVLSESKISQADARLAEALCQTAREQVREFFKRKRTGFDLPLDWMRATSFRQRVWKATMKIPFGQTTTYGALAKRIGQPRAARAVGGVLGANPFPLIVPCHRVLGANNLLTGFTAPGGVETKRRLIEFEARAILDRKGTTG